MFASIRTSATLIILLFTASYCYGQTTVWLSDIATFADLDLTTGAPPGTTVSFDIWIKTEHVNRIIAMGLDLMTTGNSIRFTGAEVVIGPDRFYAFDTAVANGGTIVAPMSAYAGAGGNYGTGIGERVPVDDESLVAYRFATVHYVVAGLGTSDLQLKVGEFLFDWSPGDPTILHLGIDDPTSDGHMPGATDTIIDGRIHVVPEPGGLLLSLIGGLCLSFTRARR